MPSPSLSDRLSLFFQRTTKTPGTLRLPPLPDSKPNPVSKSASPPAPAAILTPEERRAAMSGLNELEVKWARGGLAVAALLGAYLSYYLATHRTKHVTVHGVVQQVPLSETYLLLGAIILVFCALGFFALYRRRRTLVAFAFFLTGFAYTLFSAPLGLALVFLGGWLMLRAYRIQKYGTPSAKGAARQAATRPPRQQRKAAASVPPTPSGHKPATQNKRYTPKAPARKKIAKPAE